MFNFKKFENRNARFESRITITKSNSIGFPTRFYQDNNLKDYKYVVLYYDQDQKALAIQFTNNEEEQHKFSIIKSKEGYGGAVVATSFFKSYSLNPGDYRGRYDWEKINQEGIGELFVIKLRVKISDPQIPEGLG